MNEHDNTDDLLKKMGEAHQRYEASHDENALLLRALDGRRPASPRWSAAGWVIAAFIVVGLIIRPMLPALGGGQSAEYTINGVQVRAYQSDDKNFPGTFYGCSWEGKEFYIAQQPKAYPDEPLVAEVRLGDTGCILYPADAPLAEPNITETKKLQPALDAVSGISIQMESQKLWPADLWSIRPFIKKLARREYRLEYSGPVQAGFVRAVDMYYGSDVGYHFYGYGLSQVESDIEEPVPIRLYVWPNRFTLETKAMPNQNNVIYLSGNEKGYAAYQTPEWWGEGVKTGMLQLKRCLSRYTDLIALHGDKVSPSSIQSLLNTAQVIYSQEPSALYYANDDLIHNYMMPWMPAKLDEEVVEKQKAILKGLATKFSFKHGELSVGSQGQWQEVVLQEGNLELSISSATGYITTVFSTLSGNRSSIKLYVLNEGKYPRLECKLSAEAEALLANAAAIAKEALNAPTALWPKGEFPKEYVLNWLAALAERKVAVWDSHGNALLLMTMDREGDTSRLVINAGSSNTPELNLMLEPKGFKLLNAYTGYFISVADGKVEAVRTADALEIAVTSENVSQLTAVLDMINKHKEGIPSAVYPGIEALRRFLDHPEVAQVKEVEKLPSVPWAGKALLERYALLSFRIDDVKSPQ